MSSVWGLACTNASRAAWSVHTDRVAYCLRGGRASNENPTIPAVEASCLRTALAPRNIRQVDRRLLVGMAEANTRYSFSGSSSWIFFHGERISVLLE